MELLEREPFLQGLTEYLTDAAAGEGRVVLVSGEAGIGKSSLVRGFVEETRGDTTTGWGGCDGLFTPRPLGPLFDIARDVGGELATLLVQDTPRVHLFEGLLSWLRSDRTKILVFEDVHWADEATLDLLRFLVPRISHAPCLLLLTFRSDEVTDAHPLRMVLGSIAGLGHTRRMALPPLTEAAVRRLVGHKGLDPVTVQRITGGNPFFVTEMIAAGSVDIPETVSDAVLARIGPLMPNARRILEVSALVGMRVDPELVEEVSGLDPQAWAACLASGVLVSEGDRFAFRHELARRAIEATVSAYDLRRLHRAIFEWMRGRADDSYLSSLAHHAEASGNSDGVRRYAPRAAELAARLRSHREAAEQYARLLRSVHDLGDEERAGFLENRSYECYLTDQLNDALSARLDALRLRRKLGDRLREGDDLRWMSRLHWYLGRSDEADAAAKAAIEALEELPPGRELAMAYSNYSQLYMLRFDVDQAVQWGERALDLATDLGDEETASHALNNIGSARVLTGDPRGWAEMEDSLHRSLAEGLEEHVARAYTNLGTAAVVCKDYERATEALRAGATYCVDHDLDSWKTYMESWVARTDLETGRWAEAEDLAMSLVLNPVIPPPTRVTALVVAGLVKARRGMATDFADEALALALPTKELQRVGYVRAARSEIAWLAGDDVSLHGEARAAFELASKAPERWMKGELAFWMWRAGGLEQASPDVPDVYRLHIAGRFLEAASIWEELDQPYERAIAMAESGLSKEMRDGFDLLEALGAAATAARMRSMLRARGIDGIPRGSTAGTRANPHGLTPRQAEVLELLTQGLTDAEIATRLSLSTKTVGHHVSAVLAKLGVRSRTAAAVAGRRALDE